MARSKTKCRASVPFTAAETFDHEIADLRVEYVLVWRNFTSIVIQNGIGDHLELRKRCRELAHKIPTKLGHIAIRQGQSVECSRCGLSGTVDKYLMGHVFWSKCGEHVEPGIEPTPAQVERLLRLKNTLSAELVVASCETTREEAEMIAEGYRYVCKHCKRPLRALKLDEGGYLDSRGSANCTHAPDHEVAS